MRARRAGSLRLLLPVALLASAIAAPAADAQRRDPPRPALKAGADTNDWQAYYLEGAKHVNRAPDRALAYFHWAGRLDPTHAEPIFGQWAARWRRNPALLEEYLKGAEFIVQSGEGQQIDSLAHRALVRNPMVNRQLAFWVYQALPGDWSDDDATRGWLAYSKGDFARAARDYGDALKRPSAHPTLHYQRALAFHGLQRFDSAEVALQRLIDHMTRLDRKRLVSTYESRAMFEYARGRVLIVAGRHAEAREALGRALAEDLSLAWAHAALAELAMKERDHETAVQEYDLAVQLSPDDPALVFGYGTALMSAGRMEEAVTQLRRAIELEPYFASPYYNLAACLEKLGRPSEVAMALEGFLSRASRRYEPQIVAARTRLDRLRAAGGAP